MAKSTPEQGDKPRRLGRGLSGMLGEPVMVPVVPPAEVAASGGEAEKPVTQGLVYLKLAQIKPNRYQPRTVWDDESLGDLARSIKASGVLQPVVVRPWVGEGGGGGGGGGGGEAMYELVAGERRWRAAGVAGLERIPALVKVIDDVSAAQLALVENVQREDLRPMDRARAYQVLIERFGMTHERIADAVGLGRPSVANAVRLLELEPRLQGLVDSGKLSFGHARALLGVAPGLGRLQLGHAAAKYEWSVRRLEDEVKRHVSPGEVGGGEPTAGAGGVLADAAEEARRKRRMHLADLERQLGQHLGTKVEIQTDARGNRGRMVIEFYGVDHFDGLMSKIGFAMM